MTPFEVKKLEIEWKNCVNRHFEKPAACKNSEQIRFYVSELTIKIREFDNAGITVPDWAIALLAQYNLQLNKLLLADFRTQYAQ